jgi:PKD repeat protein
VVVQFAPVAVGRFTNNVIFTSANGGATTNAVNGTGLAAGNISVTPASYSFGALTTGTTAQTTLVVTNSGGTAVSNGTVSVTGPYSILSGATFSVPGFGTTNVVVQFAPVAVGNFTNNVTFTSANGGTATNTVNGTGAIVPVALFTGSPTNGVAPLAVTFTDSSTGTITNRLWNLGDGTTTNTMATSLSHTYGSAGTDTVSLIVSGPVGVSTNTLANYIVVITPAQLGVNPGSLTYGSVTVGLTNSLSFSVINSGQQTLTGTVATASPFLIASGSPYTVAGGQTATVSVAFAPVAVGSFTNSAIFTSNGGVSTNTVTGTGLAIGNIGVTPASYSFGALTTGTTAQTTLVVTNSGGTAVSNGTVSVTGPYSILSGATFSVPGFGTTNVVVQFAPVAVGGFTNNVIFTSANGGVSTNVVNGTGLTAGNIGVTPASYSFGALTTGTTAQTTLVVTNSGGTAVSNGTVSVTGPYSILSGATFSVPGFGTTNVVVQFAPVAVGSFTNNVIFTSANGGVSTNAVNGTGLAAGNISVTPASYSFGALTTGTTAQTTLVVTNSGGTAVSNGTVSVTGPYSILSGATFSVPGFRHDQRGGAVCAGSGGQLHQQRDLHQRQRRRLDQCGQWHRAGRRQHQRHAGQLQFRGVDHRDDGPDDARSHQLRRHSRQQRHGQRDRAVLDPLRCNLQRTGFRHDQRGGAVCAGGSGQLHQQRDLHQRQRRRLDQCGQWHRAGRRQHQASRRPATVSGR